MNKNLLNKYNQLDSLIVISGYPKREEKYSRGVCAVSSFAKNTLISLQKENPDRKIIVLTMVIDKEEIYEEDGMLIVRCFKRNSPLSYLKVLGFARKFNKTKNVLLEFEFASFGDTITTAFLSVLVWSLFISSKQITLVAHQILTDLSALSGHVVMKRPVLALFNILLPFYYRFLIIPAKNIVVLEESLKKRLSLFANPEKIRFIPHGVDSNLMKLSISKAKAREQVRLTKNELIILCFGYITWYKGTDFLVSAFKNVNKLGGKNVRLVLAGGPSFTQEKKKHYQAYYQSIVEKVKNTKNITLTGFVPEKDIPAYFSAADLVVFPYRTFMSASGPLSTALAFGKPFVVSSKLSQLFQSSDVKDSLIQANLTKNDIMFALNKKDLIQTIKKAMTPKVRSKLIHLSKALNNTRSFENLAKDYDRLISETEAKVVKFSFSPLFLVRKVKAYII